MVRFMDIHGMWVTVNPDYVVELYLSGTLADEPGKSQPLTKLEYVNGKSRIVRGDPNTVLHSLEARA